MSITTHKSTVEKESTENSTSLTEQLNNVFGGLDLPHKVREAGENAGLERIGHGCYKQAFRFADSDFNIENPSNHVLKVSTLSNPWAVRSAILIHHKIPNHILDEFCVPIKSYANDSRWMVAEMADAETEISRNERLDFENRLNDAGWYATDISYRNLGYHNNQVKLLDLGHSWRRGGNRDGEIIVDAPREEKTWSNYQ
jgi:hypothetical protein